MSYDGYNNWGYSPYYSQASQRASPPSHSQKHSQYAETGASYSTYHAPTTIGYSQAPLNSVDLRQSHWSASDHESQRRATHEPLAQHSQRVEAIGHGRRDIRHLQEKHAREHVARPNPVPDTSRLSSLVYASTARVDEGLAQRGDGQQQYHARNEDQGLHSAHQRGDRYATNSYQQSAGQPAGVYQATNQRELSHAASPLQRNNNHAPMAVMKHRPMNMANPAQSTSGTPPIFTKHPGQACFQQAHPHALPATSTAGYHAEPSPVAFKPNTGRTRTISLGPQQVFTDAALGHDRHNDSEFTDKPSASLSAELLTIDPSEVFNEEGYLRQQSACEASEGMAARPMSPENSSRDQMALEIKSMIEKMREQKSKDPALFTAIWEEVKKEQPAARTALSPFEPGKAHSSSSSAWSSKVAQSQPYMVQQHLEFHPPPSHPHHPPSSHSQYTLHSRNPPSQPHRMVDSSTDAKSHEVRNPPEKRQEQQRNKIQNTGTPSATVQIFQSSDMALVSSNGPSTMNKETVATARPKSGTGQLEYTLDSQNKAVKTEEPGKTLWPEDKRTLAAETAMRIITADTRNANRPFDKGVVVECLKRNPTYNQLCETLFGLGFIFDKRTFARALLADIATEVVAVPEDSEKKRKRAGTPESANKAAKTESAATHSDATLTKDVRTIDSTQSQTPSTSAETSTMVATQLDGAARGSNEPLDAKRQKSDMIPEAASTSLPAVVVNTSKEAMARKRNFSDIVDLTRLEDSDDDEPLPMPTNKTQAVSADQSIPEPSHAAESSLSQVRNTARLELSRPSGVAGYSGGQSRGPAIALPFDRGNALRRSTYNPATIARDFLIAKGEHPTERPLNKHLEPLLANFGDVNWKTDLASFRWDLVDPGDAFDENGKLIELPKPPTRGDVHTVVQMANTPARPPPPARTQGKTPAEPTVRPATVSTPTSRGRPRGRPRSSLTPHKLTPRSESRRVDDKQQHTPSPRAAVGVGLAGSQRGARVRTVITPHRPASNQNTNSIDAIMPTFTAINSDVFKKPAHLHHAPLTPVPGQPLGSSVPLADDDVRGEQGLTTPTAVPGSTPKRRGRPPKKQPRLGESSADQPNVALGPKRRGRPPGSKSSPHAGKPGRPAKPKPSTVNDTMPKDGVGVVIQSRSPSAAPTSLSYIEEKPEQKPKPKRWKSRPTYPPTAGDPDAFVPFKCQWIGCKAELHNLETLQKHILKLHRDKCYNESTAKYSCFWNPCGMIDAFADIASWERHIKEVHVEALAQQYGDGPTMHPAGIGYGYLENADGKRITPLIRTSGTPDPLPLYAGKGPTRAYHKAHGNLTPEARARAEAASLRFHALRAAEAHRAGAEVNKTAEWKSEGSSERSETEESEGSDEDELMRDV